MSELEENGAEFSIELINNLYAIITKLLPIQKAQEPHSKTEEHKF